MKNHYEILELSPNASQEVIRAAYKTLMQRHHPDKNATDAETKRLALAIRHAYDVLSDPSKRLAYDADLRRQSKVRIEDEALQPAAKPRKSAEETPKAQPKTVKPEVHAAKAAAYRTARVKRSRLRHRLPRLSANLFVFSFLAGIAIIAISVDVYLDYTRTMKTEKIIAIEAEKRKTEQKSVNEELTRLNSNLGENLRFELAEDEPMNGCTPEMGDCRHVLNIPKLGVKVGYLRGKEIGGYIEKHKTAILNDIRTRLAKISYNQFNQANADEVLKAIIGKQINLTVFGHGHCPAPVRRSVLTNLAEECGEGYYPPPIANRSQPWIDAISFGMYEGAEEIMLPESFILH